MSGLSDCTLTVCHLGPLPTSSLRAGKISGNDSHGAQFPEGNLFESKACERHPYCRIRRAPRPAHSEKLWQLKSQVHIRKVHLPLKPDSSSQAENVTHSI